MNIVADTMHGTMFFNTKTELRDHLRRQFGTGRFRLTKDGNIDVYAVMPNTHITGWWRFGDWGAARKNLTLSAARDTRTRSA